MLLAQTYYVLKPGIPWTLRMALRRAWAKQVSRRMRAHWPINPAAAAMPDGWSGWPDGKQFAFVLTHDVDSQRGLDRCRPLADMDMRLGFRSSFNFVPEGEYATPAALRDFLSANGFEVGVHDLRHDGKLFNSHKTFTANARRINQYLAAWGAVGFRAGFMFHELNWLRDLDILYDASAFDTDPFEPQPDGVNTIFPFWVPRDDCSGYVELPYTLPQDSTLFLLLRETSIDIWKRKLDWVAEHGGMALVTVHPDYINFGDGRGPFEYPARYYQDFLEYVRRRYGAHCWAALPRDVAAHIRSQRAPQPRVAPRGGAHPLAPAGIEGSTPAPRAAQAARRTWRLRGKRTAMVLFSHYPMDPRPRRAAEALVAEGMTVDLICLRETGTDPKRETLNGVNIRRVPLKRRRGGVLGYVFQYLAFLLIASLIVAARSLTRRYELVYVHNMPDILVASALVPKLLGAKVILDLHDPMPELMMTIFDLPRDTLAVGLLKRLEKLSIRLSDLTLTVNIACKKLFASRSCPPEKIRVVMNSPDEAIFGFRPAPARFRGGPRRADRFVIMYHGSLVERNGLDLAVDALARVRPSIPGAELRICGSENPFLRRVMESVRARDLQSAVHYLGPKRAEDMVHAIEACDVGVIPNHRNVFTELNTPTRIFEYLALGKPVIAPRAPGILDYFDPDSLTFFDLGDPEDLARQIEYVYRHPREALDIVKRGQKVYLAHAWRAERETLVNAASDLLSNGGREIS